ncbi:MAG: glycosyltransferase [Bacteroidota bacterium]|nr:glycosyltransferase [Bacteroidota bacterium]
MILSIVFFVCVFSVFHTYILFPFLLKIFALGKKQNRIIFEREDLNLPYVSILLAVHNEESVIVQKIQSTFKTNYPVNKIEFLIGSDASDDSTNEIIKEFRTKFPNIQLIEFNERMGKVKIINSLALKAKGEIFILTDANVFFAGDTIYQLVKHYKNPSVSITGGNILNYVKDKNGISHQEKYYLSRENAIKYNEGLIWGAMIGSFGGCYSIRASMFNSIPDDILYMDDFYITLNVLNNGGKAINEMDAISYEDVSDLIEEEFRRKIRISLGTIPILLKFYRLWLPPFNGVAFSLFSHKVLRYMSPLLIILTFIINIFLLNQGTFYFLTLILQLLLFVSPFVDFIMRQAGINFKPLRFITHFIYMNIALLW